MAVSSDKHFRYLSPGLILLTLSLLLLGTFWYWSYSQDDVYITYRYSRNIATGVGFVFNSGEAVQGTTTPLFALLLAGVYYLTPDLVHAGNLISALSLAGICLVTFWLGQHFGGAWLGWGAVLMLALNPWFYIAFGMETLTYTLLLMVACWCALRQQDGWAGFFAGLLAVTRPDGVLLIGVLGLTALLTRRRIPWIGILVSALVAGSWYGYAWVTFGSPLPQTFSAKVTIFSGWEFFWDGWEWFRALYLDGMPLYGLAAIFLLVGLLVSLYRRTALCLLWGWAAIYTAGYTILNVTAFWYYVPLLPPVVLTVGYGAQVCFDWLRTAIPNRWVRYGLAIAILGALLAGQVRSAYAFSPAPGRVATYRLVGEWLTDHSPADAYVLVGDLGVVGWYAERPILDIPGLVAPNLYQRTETYALLKYQPDYFLATQYWSWARVLQEEWLTRAYQPVAQISTPGDVEFSPMTIYQRRYPMPSFGETWSWGDWQVQAGLPAAPVSPGTYWPLVLRATAPIGTDTQFNWPVCLLTPTGSVVLAQTIPFFAGLYPSAHTLGAEVITDAVWLMLPLSLTTSTLEVWLGEDCTRPTQRLGSLQNSPLEATENSPQFGNVLQLLTATPLEPVYWSGGEIRLTFYWQMIQPPAQNLSVFVHVLNQSGQLVAQNDGWPAGLPTVAIPAEQVLVEIRTITLPPDLPPGDYQVVIGLYEPTSNERVLLSNGQPAALLGTFTAQWPGGSGRP